VGLASCKVEVGFLEMEPEPDPPAAVPAAVEEAMVDEALTNEQLSEVNGWKEEKEGRLAEMAGIEEEYSTLKERLYQQRLSTVQELLDQLREGAHPRYKQQKAELEVELDRQKQNAEVRKAYRMVTLDHQTAYTTKRVAQDYEFRVTLLKAKMIQKLRRELRQIETEKREINTPVVPAPQPVLYRSPPAVGGATAYPPVKPVSISPPKRSAPAPPAPPAATSPRPYESMPIGAAGAMTEPRQPASKRRRKTPVTSTQFPFVVYMLSEDEISRDLELFRRFDMRAPHKMR